MKFMMYVFKPSGKYYTHEEIDIPTTIPVWELPDAVRNGTIYTGYKDMYKMFICIEPDQDNMSRDEQMYTVPFMVYS